MKNVHKERESLMSAINKVTKNEWSVTKVVINQSDQSIDRSDRSLICIDWLFGSFWYVKKFAIQLIN